MRNGRKWIGPALAVILGIGLLAAVAEDHRPSRAASVQVANPDPVQGRPVYWPAIDPTAPTGALWTLTNPTRTQCRTLAKMVESGKLAYEARYDPNAPCQIYYGEVG